MGAKIRNKNEVFLRRKEKFSKIHEKSCIFAFFALLYAFFCIVLPDIDCLHSWDNHPILCENISDI